MKKLWLNIRIFFHYLAHGMKAADDLLTTSEKTNADGSGVEQQNEKQSVYADLLKGEVTQEVKELRHEMYYAERESHKFSYNGGGRAKRNDVFGYNGKLEDSDGFTVQIVQETKEIPATLMECGIYCVGKEVNLSEVTKGDMGLQDYRNYTLDIKRDFLPTFKIEAYTTKLVVKRSDDRVLLDFYVSQYPKQFDNRSKLFVREIEKIYEGDVRSDVIDFNNVKFISNNAYGSDDLKVYSYGELEFITIKKFDGSYVLKFEAHKLIADGDDLISEFYDESAARKSENHEARANAPEISLDEAMANAESENYDVETAEKLLNELK